MKTKDEIINDQTLTLHDRARMILPMMKYSISEDITNDPIHIFKNDALDYRNLHEKIKFAFSSSYILYNQDNPCERNSVEFANYLFNSVLDEPFRVQCVCCGSSRLAFVRVDFINMIIHVHDDFDHSRFKEYDNHRATYGTAENKCRDVYDKTKFKFDFKCKSGRIVIANDLRETSYFKERTIEEYFSINEKMGMLYMINYWASHNALYMQCGNT